MDRRVTYRPLDLADGNEAVEESNSQLTWPSTHGTPAYMSSDLTTLGNINHILHQYRGDNSGPDCECRCRCHRVCNHEEIPSSIKDDSHAKEWAWDHSLNSENTELSHHDLEVTFHKHFSNGTAAIRGSTPLKDDQHYWEIKMTTSVYGTDMMVGFGTEAVNLRASATRFTSLLGVDSESWGLSYTGNLVHNGVKRKVCRSFGQGVTIGIHVNMWLGKMSIFRNNKFVGVGFSKGIRGKKIYPMACSTAARTGMRIVRSCSFPTSLQFMCCQVLRNAVPADKDVSEAVALAPGLRLFLANNLDWLLRPYSPEQVNETVGKLRKRGMTCVQPDASGYAETVGEAKRACTEPPTPNETDIDVGTSL